MSLESGNGSFHAAILEDADFRLTMVVVLIDFQS